MEDSMSDRTTAWIGLLDKASNTAASNGTGDDPALVPTGLQLAWATMRAVEVTDELDSEMAWATAADALANARDLLDQPATGTAPSPPPHTEWRTEPRTQPQPDAGPEHQNGPDEQVGQEEQAEVEAPAQPQPSALPHPQGPLLDGPVLRHSTAVVLDAVHDSLLRRIEASVDGRSRLRLARAAALIEQAADELR
jgi:hypothetical protein